MEFSSVGAYDCKSLPTVGSWTVVSKAALLLGWKHSVTPYFPLWCEIHIRVPEEPRGGTEGTEVGGQLDVAHRPACRKS